MHLRETILAEHSKAQTNAIVTWVGSSQQRFDELFHLFMTGEYRVVQRAAWPVSYCVIEHPGFITKHLKQLIGCLRTPGQHDAVKRNTVRLLQHIDIPKRWQGAVMDICFGYIASPTEAVAIKAFSLSILQNLAKRYQEIKEEVKLIIEDQWEGTPPAFRSRAKNFWLP